MTPAAGMVQGAVCQSHLPGAQVSPPVTLPLGSSLSPPGTMQPRASLNEGEPMRPGAYDSHSTGFSAILEDICPAVHSSSQLFLLPCLAPLICLGCCCRFSSRKDYVIKLYVKWSSYCTQAVHCPSVGYYSHLDDLQHPSDLCSTQPAQLYTEALEDRYWRVPLPEASGYLGFPQESSSPSGPSITCTLRSH